MSTPARIFDRLPPALRPREADDGGGRGRRTAELAFLIVLGVLLAAATINDLAKQVRTDIRLGDDKKTWVAYTQHPVKKLTLIAGIGTTRDVVCGPPFTGADYRQCLVMVGPTRSGVRTVAGGYRLPLTGNDLYRHRWACAGEPAQRQLCVSDVRPPD